MRLLRAGQQKTCFVSSVWLSDAVRPTPLILWCSGRLPTALIVRHPRWFQQILPRRYAVKLESTSELLT